MLPAKKTQGFALLGTFILHLSSSLALAPSAQRIWRRNEPPVLPALSQGAASVPVLRNLNLTGLPTIRQEACEES